MGLAELLTVLVVIGLVLYLLQLVPMDPRIKTAMLAVTIAFVILWMIRALLGVGPILSIH